MLLDPETGRCSHDIDEITAAVLSLELVPLGELARWLPVGGLLVTLAGALTGNDSISRDEIERLRRWCRNWTRLAPELREFYRDRATLEDERVNQALWFVLDGGTISRPAQGIVRRLFEETAGHRPVNDLFPRPREPRPPRSQR